MLLTAGLAAAPAPAPVELTLRAMREQMKYDLSVLEVPVGSRVRLHFKNDDGMAHNVLICLPRELCSPGLQEDNGLEVAQAAWALGAEGPARQWVPKHPRVLVASTMLNGGQEETIEFDAPARPGRYPYLCSFPGHAMSMYGFLHVQTPVAGLQNLRYTVYRTGALKAFPNFATLSEKVIASGPLPDGLIDARPVSVDDHYAIEFTATLPIPQDGDYTFSLAADKGTQLWIDGALAVDNRTGHSVRAVKSGKVSLQAGPRSVAFRYWHQPGDEPQATLVWRGPHFDERALSRINLVELKRQNDGDRLEGMSLRPEANEPVFYHNYLADLPLGGYAVGFPGGANLSWDSRSMNLSSVWTGDFLDVKAHRTFRGAGAIKPAGTDLQRPAPGRAFPESAGELRYLGYRFDAARRPLFRYRLGALAVTETYDATGKATDRTLTLTRTLHFQGPPPTGLTLRLATAGPGITLQPDGVVLDGQLRISARDTAPLPASGSAQTGVHVPIRFSGDSAQIVIDYRWLAPTLRPADLNHAHGTP